MTRPWSTPHRTIGRALAVLLALLGLAAPAAAADRVPFSASITGVITGTTHLPGGITQLNADLAGNATHLGNYIGTATILQDNHGNETGTACWVAANGTDRVCFEWSGVIEQAHGSCVATSSGPYTVTGGAGRFDNATGGGTYTRQFDTCTGNYSAELTGTISRPSS